MQNYRGVCTSRELHTAKYVDFTVVIVVTVRICGNQSVKHFPGYCDVSAPKAAKSPADSSLPIHNGMRAMALNAVD